MPDTLAPPRLEAVTPSLGVRLWVEGGLVCLQSASEGGRGAPLAMLVLPVMLHTTGQVQLACDLPAADAPEAQVAAFLEQHWRATPKTLSTPFVKRFNRTNWVAISAGQPQVLVLLLYHRIGHTDAQLLRLSDLPWNDIHPAVVFFFDKAQKPVWLRRGLVTLAPADVPLVDVALVDAPDPADKPAAAAASGAGPQHQAQPVPAALPPTAVTLALASCQYPAGLLDGTPRDWVVRAGWPSGPADASLLRLAQRLDSADEAARPSLLVLCGDQIYADATAGLFDPRATPAPADQPGLRDAADWLRVPYQNWLGSVGVQSVLGRLPSRLMLDDHEIADNWAPLPCTASAQARHDNLARMQAGSHAYQRYQRNLPESKLLPVLWHTHQHRGMHLFMADTRTERGLRQAGTDPLAPRILSDKQHNALAAWLQVQPERPAFVASPSMLLPRRRSSVASRPIAAGLHGAGSLRGALQSDAWCGYPGSLHTVLAQVWRSGRSNLVFLSGDEHLSGVVEATVSHVQQGRAVRLLSVHSSGLYAPYPFANAVPAEFKLPDDWTFSDPCAPHDVFRCQVRLLGDWVPGDGFALISLAPPAAGQAGPGTAGDWHISVAFDRAAPGLALPDPTADRPAPLPTVQAYPLSAPG